MTDLGWVGLIRHGESTGNVAREAAESGGLEVIDIPERDADVPLSDRGEEQARAVGRWLAELPPAQRPDVVVSSPYRRAMDTARLALEQVEGYRPTFILDERLRDRELGVLDLLTQHGVSERYPDELVRKRRLGKFYYRPPGGESWADVALRLRTLFADLTLAHRGERVLLFAHEMTAYLLRYLLEGVPEPELLTGARATTVANGSLTAWEPHGDGYSLVSEHETEHLQEHGAQPTETEDASTRSA
jgi:probable phosphoglycerate mutase